MLEEGLRPFHHEADHRDPGDGQPSVLQGGQGRVGPRRSQGHRPGQEEPTGGCGRRREAQGGVPAEPSLLAQEIAQHVRARAGAAGQPRQPARPEPGGGGGGHG